MVWWLIILLISLFFVWFLFGPIFLRINTSTNRYEVFLPGIFRGMVIPTDDFVKIKLWIAFIPVTFDPLNLKKKEKRKKSSRVKKKRKKNTGSFGVGRLKKLMTSILKTFTIKKFVVNIDTGDYLLNSRLVPLFVFLSGKSRYLSVNFMEVNHLEIIIMNRIINFVKIAIKTFVLKS